MSFFGKILEKLGLKKAPSEKTSTPGPQSTGGTGHARTPSTGTPSTTTAKPSTTGGPAKPGVSGTRAGSPGPAAQAPAGTKAISEVDVVKQLEDRARGSGLNWKVSIVDLLKLLDLDSSREARNELATELGAPADVMSDSARMNTWLHKEVLRRIAQNGGNIPQDLLD